MTMQDFHTDLYVVAGDSFFGSYKSDSTVRIPLGISAVTNSIPQNMKIRYSVFGWDELAEKFEYTSGEMKAAAEPFTYSELSPVEIKMPGKTAVMILSTALEDENGNVIHRNFVPFKVDGKPNNEVTVISKSPSEFTDASWSIKHRTVQNGNKLWGMGSGFFEYDFELPKNLEPKRVKSVEFRAELASRYPQGKYLEKGEAEGIGMTIVSEKGTDPGYGKNSFPQTDEKKHGSLVKITANEKLIGEVELSDDPADHNGILSWINQTPGWEWGSADKSKPWLLDEAGSYGYPVIVSFDETAKNMALETGKITIRLHVDESTVNRGGLTVYGKNSGRFPLNPSLIIKYN